MVWIVNSIFLSWFSPILNRTDILFCSNHLNSSSVLEVSCWPGRLLKRCNTSFKRGVSLLPRIWNINPEVVSQPRSREAFLFSLIRKMASEGEAGSAAATEAEPGEGYGSFVARSYFYIPIWGFIEYYVHVLEEKSHGSTKCYEPVGMLTLALSRQTKRTTLSCNLRFNLAQKKKRFVKHV